MAKLEIIPQELKGVYEIKFEPNQDDRGFFMRTYDDLLFKEFGLDKKWVQENHAFTKQKGTIRGLHLQFPPNSETKLVRVVSGELMDVYVDLRKNSPTFGKWGSMILSVEKKNALLIPKGFAHGICTLTDNCEMLYKVDNYYARDNQCSIKWNDPDIGVKWPIEQPPLVSEKDKNAISFKEFREKYASIEIK